MLSGVPGDLYNALEGQIVGLAGPGGIDDLLRLHPQQTGDLGRHKVYLGVDGLSGGMGGVGVADVPLLRLIKSVQHGGVRRGVGGIIQIDHQALSPMVRSFTTSPATISPAAAGTKALLPGTCRR